MPSDCWLVPAQELGDPGKSSRILWNAPMRGSHWQTSLLDLRNALPMRAEPRKKKRVDPKRELAAKERLKKKMKKLERIPPELIPIEDFTTPAKYLDETRRRDLPKLGFEESERRALLMKEWARYKQKQHEEEVEAVEAMLEAQREALQELRQESEELYQAAMKCDQGLIPLESHGPCNTPPLPGYQAPEGKYNDITRAYTQ
ncbi:39S ribosomal protein L40, mitochondrial isoform X2 [Latimeria chalumnae]|uniref:39S ribosomal protein L40, mitochondrial isoform X2 n=1 Tax=Latimeria chalumnae TaxID=7897 RepID=UPI0003C135F5|nr:PREDICTED: 39S ribosomal protein L40, mitochondrial isoform X2 [Latimeria chalumnae]|eukprot:XP_005990247.1 PREDICTED: 39S ribosomal protein L40, mitochondrial isoform X2 [Latimeria chalumnae]